MSVKVLLSAGGVEMAWIWYRREIKGLERSWVRGNAPAQLQPHACILCRRELGSGKPCMVGIMLGTSCSLRYTLMDWGSAG